MITLAVELKRVGYAPKLLCVSKLLAEAWESEVGTDAILVPTRRGRTQSRVGLNVAVWSAVARQRDLAAVVVFSYALAAGGVLYRLRRRAIRGVAVLDLHDNLEGPRGRWLLRLAARSFDAVISVSRHTDAQLDRVQTRRTVIYRPIASPPQVGRTSEERAFRVGVVGRLVPQKKIDLAVGAVSGLGENFCLIVRGEPADGGDRAFAEDLISQTSALLGPRFRFDGAVEWTSVLQGLDVVVVCNDNEPMGRTVPEAQLAGVLVIVPNRGGSSELVEHGVTGLIYEAADSDALAEAITIAAELGQRRGEIIHSAREVARLRHEPASYSARYIEAAGWAARP